MAAKRSPYDFYRRWEYWRSISALYHPFPYCSHYIFISYDIIILFFELVIRAHNKHSPFVYYIYNIYLEIDWFEQGYK